MAGHLESVVDLGRGKTAKYTSFKYKSYSLIPQSTIVCMCARRLSEAKESDGAKPGRALGENGS